MTLNLSLVQELATAEGLQVLGISDIAPIPAARNRLIEWQEAGYAGSMSYMQRSHELSDPRAIAPWVQSIIVCGIRYSHLPHPLRPPGFGRVARYAWGLDYHSIVKQRLSALGESLASAEGGKSQWMVVSDSTPLLERSLGQKAGIGFAGRNSMLIRPGFGSYFFLGELLLEAELEGGLSIAKGSCGTCTRCVAACPTDAIVADGVIDSRLCLAYLSIERRGFFTEWEREALGEWVFGCDLCQEICPFNHAALRREVPPDFEEFDPRFGPGPLLDLGALLNLRSSRAFNKRFRHTAVWRARREGLVRNAACVAANTGSDCVAEELVGVFENDSDAVVRATALWALAKLNMIHGAFSRERLSRLLEHARLADELIVVKEAQELSERLIARHWPACGSASETVGS